MVQTIQPTTVGILAGLPKGLARLDNPGCFQTGESFLCICVNACSDTCTPGRTLSPIRIIKFYHGTGNSGKGFPENWAQEHIGISGPDCTCLAAQAPHNFQTVMQGKYNSFLRRPEQVTLPMHVKIKAVH